jgi:hypothetical protein
MKSLPGPGLRDRAGTFAHPKRRLGSAVLAADIALRTEPSKPIPPLDLSPRRNRQASKLTGSARGRMVGMPPPLR